MNYIYFSEEKQMALCLRKLIFSDTAYWTYKVLWQVLESCTWLYAIIWISYCWIILPTTCVAYILFHNVFVCIASSHESKSACQPLKAGARSFDLPSANICINLYITKYFCDFLIINHKKTDFRSVCRLVMMKNIVIGVQ